MKIREIEKNSDNRILRKTLERIADVLDDALGRKKAKESEKSEVHKLRE